MDFEVQARFDTARGQVEDAYASRLAFGVGVDGRGRDAA